MPHVHPLDIELKLLAGMTVEVGNIKLKPFTLKEIANMGYSIYMFYSALLTIDIEKTMKDLDGQVPLHIKNKLSPFDLIIGFGSKELRVQIINAFSFFLREDKVSYSKENQSLIYGDNKQVNSENFLEILDILKIQNGLEDIKDKKMNPADERAKSIIDKLKRGREITKQAKAKANGDDNEITFMSIISSVSAKSNTISKFNIWDLTVYQLYDEYKRLELMNSYDNSIMAMMNGADIKDLKHWSSTIKD